MSATRLRRLPARGGRPSRAAGAVPARPRRVPALALAAAVMVGALLAVLVVNIALSRGSYTAQRLTARASQLSDTEQELAEDLQVSAAPSALASHASAMGLVADPDPGYLRLDGTVLGAPASATPAAVPSTTPAAAPATASSPASSPTSAPASAPTSPASPSTSPSTGPSATASGSAR